MRIILITASLALFAAGAACAGDEAPKPTGWTGSGELGFAATRGNSRSTALNAKLEFSKEDDSWKHHIYLAALRNKAEIEATRIVNGNEVSTDIYETTANRIELGASSGYKLNLRSYVVGALRYENDDFSAYEWQAAASIGYGYIAIKNQTTDLSFEIGPGYKRVQPVAFTVSTGLPPVTTVIRPDAESSIIGRGLMSFRYRFSESTSFENKLLVEAGDERFVQNDTGLVVDINDALALKVGYQIRYHSQVAPGQENTDQLLTTNLVYNFK